MIKSECMDQNMNPWQEIGIGAKKASIFGSNTRQGSS
jgi:hypothetical protein